MERRQLLFYGVSSLLLTGCWLFVASWDRARSAEFSAAQAADVLVPTAGVMLAGSLTLLGLVAAVLSLDGSRRLRPSGVLLLLRSLEWLVGVSGVGLISSTVAAGADALKAPSLVEQLKATGPFILGTWFLFLGVLLAIRAAILVSRTIVRLGPKGLGS